ncbi:MAG: rod shape-determining protein MreC [Alphaproteobacteria bacterium]|nr:rod shape-determining protein MreC [Alphaproteobacteria bacterium]
MKDAQFRRFALPFRGVVQRSAIGLLVLVAVTFMALDQAGSPAVESLRTRTVDTLQPLLEVLSHPATFARRGADDISRFFHVYADNRRLREENTRLLAWQDVARRLEKENLNLRNLATIAPEARAAFTTARIVATSGGAFVRTVLVNAGRQDGVTKGQAVVAAEGLVGRVVEVGDRTARVLLLTDLNSRIPVRLESTRDSAILAGDNSDRLRLNFLPADAVPTQGDRVITSGEGGQIPPGLPAGLVVGVEDGSVIVRPLVDWQRLEFVNVLDYAVPGVLPQTREAGQPDTLW